VLDRKLDELSCAPGKVLCVDNLGKFYPSSNVGRWALRGISFNLQMGNGLAVVGQNGSGKSTLLRILAGVILPSEGRAVGYGRVVSLYSRSLGITPEATILSALTTQASFFGVKRGDVVANLAEMLDWCELPAKPNDRIYTLSAGMTERLAFAGCLFMKPRLLLADGRLGVGDPGFHERCLYRVEKLIAEDGMALVLSTHRQSLAERFCHETLVLEDGRRSERVFWPGSHRIASWPMPALLSKGTNDSEDTHDVPEDADEELLVLDDLAEREPHNSCGVVSTEVVSELPSSMEASDVLEALCMNIAVDVPEDAKVRMKADFYRGRELGFRAISPEFFSGSSRQHFRLNLPSNFLLPGKWRIEVAPVSFVGASNTSRIEFVSNSPDKTAMGDWFGRMPGPVAPKVEWELGKLDSNYRHSTSLISNGNGAILAVRLVSDPVREFVSAEQPCAVEVDFSLALENLPARCCLDFLREGDRAFRVLMPQPRPISAGFWRARALFPSNILAEGAHVVNVILIFPDPTGPAPLMLYNALQFNVESDCEGGARAGWTGPMPGVVMPLLQWRQDKAKA